MEYFSNYRYRRSLINKMSYTNADYIRNKLYDYSHYIDDFLYEIDSIDLDRSIINYLIEDPFILLQILLSNSQELNEIENFTIIKETILRRINLNDIYLILIDIVKNFIDVNATHIRVALSDICSICVSTSISFHNIEMSDRFENFEDIVLPLVPIIADTNVESILGGESILYIDKIKDKIDESKLIELQDEKIYEDELDDLNEYNMYDILFFLLTPEIAEHFNYITCLTIMKFKGKDAPNFDKFFKTFLNTASKFSTLPELEPDDIDDLKYVCLYIWFYSKYTASSIFSIYIELKMGVFSLIYFEENLKNLILTSLTTLRMLN